MTDEPAGPGASVGWFEGSAQGLPFPAGSYDVVLCQLGLQFFPDQPAALAEMRRVLVTGGRSGPASSRIGTRGRRPAPLSCSPR